MNESSVTTTEQLQQWVAALASVDTHVDDAERVCQLGLLESIKSAAAAAQARVAVDFDFSQRAMQHAAGLPAQESGKGVAEQVALARRESPTRGSRHLGLAKALVHELPHTMAALTQGRISEWRATLVSRATAGLRVEHRRAVDEGLAGQLDGMSDRAVEAAANRAAYELDPQSALERGRRAAKDRRVTVRPALDMMANVCGFVPMAQGVAVFAALDRYAKALKAQGDERSLDQIKADTFVERLTGQASASAVPLEINLVMTDGALFDGEQTPATLEHFGPIPAAAARDLIREAEAAQAKAWVRRLITDPVTGVINDADQRRRRFAAAVRRVVVARDQWCRTPWCGAPIRHIDHVHAFARGGATHLANAQGLCERCNQAKQAPGWEASVIPDPRGPNWPSRVRTTTATGHAYESAAPPPATVRVVDPQDTSVSIRVC